ncbi:MAG: single-stranded DNA-binding protein [Bacillota bacterium]|nr:single-stranded DNA-binding protein [Bacillota bacterium]
MNNVTLIGRLVKDPEIRHLQGSGRTVCDFRLAVDKQLSREKRAQFEATGKPTADFIRIVVWGRQAEICNTYLKKGAKVAIQGSISTSSYADEHGVRKYFTDVVARNVEFLERVEAMYASNDSGLIDEMSADFDDDDFPILDDPGNMPF